jgi:hypothetical protein
MTIWVVEWFFRNSASSRSTFEIFSTEQRAHAFMDELKDAQYMVDPIQILDIMIIHYPKKLDE